MHAVWTVYVNLCTILTTLIIGVLAGGAVWMLYEQLKDKIDLKIRDRRLNKNLSTLKDAKKRLEENNI
jgi:low affinity Fe/Cu permease